MTKRLGIEDRFWSKVNKDGPLCQSLNSKCWVWLTSLDHGGYGRFRLRLGTVSAHRFSWELRNGKVENGLFVLHKCDVPRCVNPDHLFLGTNLDNSRDAEAKGRAFYTKEYKESHPGFVKKGGHGPRGDKSGSRKINSVQVKQIREMYASGKYLQRELAVMFGLHRIYISRIIRKVAWKFDN